MDERTKCGRVILAGGAAILLGLAVTVRLGAVDFIRGDANGDGAVSLSDSHYLSSFLFLGGSDIECRTTSDANDDGHIDVRDSVMIAVSPFSGETIPAPFPGLGSDPTPDPELACPSYGSGSPVDDPVARIEVLSARAPGGDDRRAVITVALSHSVPVVGYELFLRDESGVLDPTRKDLGSNGSASDGLRDLTGGFNDQSFLLLGLAEAGRVHVRYLPEFRRPFELAPGEDVAVLEILLCLPPGTPAGEYPLALDAGELVAAGDNSPSTNGRAIHPALQGGTLHVESPVHPDASLCETLVPIPPRPRNIAILFKLEDATAAPGGSAQVPFIIKADRESTGFSYSIDFDEGVLQYAGEEKLWDKPDGTPYAFEKFEFSNTNGIPGNAGVDEGYLAGAAVISLTDTGDVLPPRTEVAVLGFDFLVSPEAPAGSTEIRFIDGGLGSGGPVKNKLIAEGTDITPEVASSFVFVNALISIVPDGTPFVRGDANGDRTVNISDPTFTLNHLFLGGREPECLDAADANDDARLNIADAVETLNYLFIGSRSPPLPFPGPGSDPTPDDPWTCGETGS